MPGIESVNLNTVNFAEAKQEGPDRPSRIRPVHGVWNLGELLSGWPVSDREDQDQEIAPIAQIQSKAHSIWNSN
jgi:hypothetical protein